MIALTLAMNVASCDQPKAKPPSTQEIITVASLVPAATDLIDGMGARDHLIAISNWDPNRDDYASLPRVGDYRSIDWERITQLQPRVMIVQFREDKKPAGLEEKSRELNIRLVNVHNNDLADVYTTLDQLGDALNERAKSDQTKTRIAKQISAVADHVKDRPHVTALIVRSSSGFDVVGGGNFMDELLTIAGGRNVMGGGENSYPTIDRELLLKLDPEVILQTLPGSAPQVLEQARAMWKSIPDLRAVKHNRVHLLTEDFLLLPGANVGRIAEIFAEKLHAESRP